MPNPEDTQPSLTQDEKWRCVKCGCLWRKSFEASKPDFDLWDATQNTCMICDNSPYFLDNIERVDDSVGLTKDESGVISIGPGGLKQALKDQAEAMQDEQDALNEELASGRAAGAEAGSDQPDAKNNSGA